METVKIESVADYSKSLAKLKTYQELLIKAIDRNDLSDIQKVSKLITTVAKAMETWENS